MERQKGFKDLIDAVRIFDKYVGDEPAGMYCSHDELTICGVDPGKLSRDDLARVVEAGFFVDGCEGIDEIDDDLEPEKHYAEKHYAAVQAEAAEEFSEMCFKSFRWGSC